MNELTNSLSLPSSHVDLWLTSSIYHTFCSHLCTNPDTHTYIHKLTDGGSTSLSLGMEGREAERDVILKM